MKKLSSLEDLSLLFPDAKGASAPESKSPKTKERPKGEQIIVSLNTKMIAGKKATWITGFMGGMKEVEAMLKKLKNACGTGGTEKEGGIMLQGDFVKKAFDILQKEGFNPKLK